MQAVFRTMAPRGWHSTAVATSLAHNLAKSTDPECLRRDERTFGQCTDDWQDLAPKAAIQLNLLLPVPRNSWQVPSALAMRVHVEEVEFVWGLSGACPTARGSASDSGLPPTPTWSSCPSGPGTFLEPGLVKA
jgi:hypothetical protein